ASAGDRASALVVSLSFLSFLSFPNSVWERLLRNSVSRLGLPRNRVSRSAFPNRVWERGDEEKRVPKQSLGTRRNRVSRSAFPNGVWERGERRRGERGETLTTTGERQALR